jgi:hypothetical protein
MNNNDILLDKIPISLEMNENIYEINLTKKYICNKCNYICSKKSEFIKHELSKKHKNIINLKKIYKCNCGKIYKHSSTLYTHKKKCQESNRNNIDNINNKICEKTDEDKIIELENTITPELVIELIRNTKNLQEIIIQQNETINNLINNSKTTYSIQHCEGKFPYINNINNINTYDNKTFNLQIFLNETCKDAMNLTDFVDSIKIKVEDLVKIGQVGYIKGISNIINENLQRLDITERPLHCTDKKRETIYSKENNKWEKEDDNKTKLRKAIKKVSNKNIFLLKDYREKYPDYKNSESIQSDIYDKLLFQVMGGKGDNNKEKEDKIISNISKNIVINKSII